MHKTAFVWDDQYLEYSFPGDHPFKSLRESMAKKFLEERGAFHQIDLVKPVMINEDLLYKVHAREYVEFVKKKSADGSGYLDEGDTPAFKGIYESALIRTSGTVTAIKILDKYDHSVNIGGGFHHAKYSSASGFCVFNDVALGIKIAEEKFKKIALVDIDGHHGDGTQLLLANDTNVLKISLHMFHKGFFPGSGDAEEIGEGEAKGLTVNIPLPPGTGDDMYLYAFNEIAVPKLESFKPDLVFILNGGDSHFTDPLVELKLSNKGYLDIIKKIHDISHKYNAKIVMTGGGGYNYESTAKIWTLSIAELAKLDFSEFLDLEDCCYIASSEFVKKKVIEIVEKLKKIHGL
ncbi:acetoin utilization protein AcuC [Stygiolobus caldivivus]|uniref:Acetoin utilization protein AcuC n=1 Tax=Stygiolobus caldivivus TaxID=2824673 RepID=A0A8D5U4T0_9CREN|nr:acetoin utilization protein AcuC [Stygiolobus caldivivus]BCU69431.1 acetoin utilization protein AcuC [Stygiolobus caldivivus]